MADGTLINGTTWHGDFVLDKQTGTTLELNVRESYVAKNIVLALAAQIDSVAVKGGALNSQAASATFTNMTTNSTNTSGIEIQTQGSAGRDAILLDGDIDGWVTGSEEDSVGSAIAASSWNGTKYYATGVTLTAGKAFSITVPNGGNDTITFNFSVDANGNTTIE